MARYAVNAGAVEKARALIDARHKQVERAAYDLLQELDRRAGIA